MALITKITRNALIPASLALATLLACTLLAAPARGASSESPESLTGMIGTLVEGALEGQPPAEAEPPPASAEPSPAPAPEPASEPTSSQSTSPKSVNPVQAGERGEALEGPVSAPAPGPVTDATEEAAAPAPESAAAPTPRAQSPAHQRPRVAAPAHRSLAPALPPAVEAATSLTSAAPKARPQPAVLSDWIGSDPPLPPAFVYLAAFACVLAIVVSTRRELGLGPRRRRRL